MEYVISASYGNDSAAMIQWAHEHGLKDVTVAYCDTGWAAPGWELRVEEGEALCKRLGFPTVQLKSMGMEALVRMKKGFPGNGQQFCTAWLKGLPFLQWIDEADPECKAVVMVGKRREESTDRKDTPEWVDDSEYHGGRRLWHPLYLHSENERDALLQRAGVKKMAHRSDECSPCVNANRDDLRSRRRSGVERSVRRRTVTMEWQPIETAPKDGMTVELLGENGKLDIGHWCEWSEHFDKTANGIPEDVTGEFSTEYGEGPHTHWRPLSSNAELCGGASAPSERT